MDFVNDSLIVEWLFYLSLLLVIDSNLMLILDLWQTKQNWKTPPLNAPMSW